MEGGLGAGTDERGALGGALPKVGEERPPDLRDPRGIISYEKRSQNRAMSDAKTSFYVYDVMSAIC